MGELIDFTEYLKAKRQGMSPKEYRAAKRMLDEVLSEIPIDTENPAYEFAEYINYAANNPNWPKGYPFVLIEDMETGYYDDCDHTKWHVVEQDFQITCNECDLNAWSAPW